MTNISKYDCLFSDLLDLIEFSVTKYDDGYGLVDAEGVNLGDIEGERFDNAQDMVDRLDTYIHDRLLDDEVWGTYESCEEALAKRPRHPLRKLFDLIANHLNEVNLANVY